MKIREIFAEHKKGVRAKKYNRKPKPYIDHTAKDTPAKDKPKPAGVFEEQSTEPRLIQAFRDFFPVVIDHLNLETLPKIDFANDTNSNAEQPAFGAYSHDPGNKVIRIDIRDRHPVDIIRTLAHELVHYKQDLEGRLSDDSGMTGSPIENEAHATAGAIMRNFGKAFPQYFDNKAITID
jgi:hypothetical protein